MEARTNLKVRPGTPDDVPELVRLRRLMIESVGLQYEGPDGRGAEWEATCAGLLTAGLADGSFHASVVDDPDRPGCLAACGVGMVGQRLPGPGNPNGKWGYIQSMATDDAHRRRGLARAIFEDLMAWFDSVGVTSVDLHASDMGAPLYRQYGFEEGRQVELRWRKGAPAECA